MLKSLRAEEFVNNLPKLTKGIKKNKKKKKKKKGKKKKKKNKLAIKSKKNILINRRNGTTRNSEKMIKFGLIVRFIIKNDNKKKA